jgi:uncharacterized repeat protein (TIGR04052 family)
MVLGRVYIVVAVNTATIANTVMLINTLMSVANKYKWRLIMRKIANKPLSSFSFTNLKKTLVVSAILLALVNLIGCYQPSHENQQITINVAPFYKDTPITCDGVFYHNGEKWQINTLSFFVSKPLMTQRNTQHNTKRNTQQNLAFAETEWQTNDVALIWFANSCDPHTTNNTTLMLKVSPTHELNAHYKTGDKTKPITTLEFSMGVPFAQNHANPLLQASPLNIPEMFWSWRNGYKFMRFDASATESSNNWSLHLGSLGCQSTSSLRAPAKPCAMPNLFKYQVNLPDIISQDKNILSIKIDIALLVNNMELKQGNSCMFDYNQQNQCQAILNNLEQNPLFSIMSQP